ncbi:portal protein [Cypionkella sp. TWP1-2-1b2]|uniref:portal protein n=1 Tax=Cypionkella sp. TWP1-2-1b2 TaxID=2804675 RepID=UPI003CF8108F
MARMSKADRLKEIHETALRQFEASWSVSWPDREAALAARRFVDIRGAQWDWDTNNDFAVRMKLEFNFVSLACTRINNEYKANEIEAQFIPKDGTEADPIADLCASRYRADFQDSNGKEARDNAFDEMIKGGMGAVRYRTEFEDERKGTQRIVIEPIHDAATTVYFDANSKRKDKSDAEHAFLIRPYTKDAYKTLFGDEGSDWPLHLKGQFEFAWFGDLIYVAEYFVKTKGSEIYRSFTAIDGSVEEYCADDLTAEDVADMMAQGYVEGETFKTKQTTVRKYTLSGAKVLSDDGEIAGDRIPIAVGYAYRSVINGVERFRGHVLPAIDPQILFDIWVSKMAEIAASSAVEVPIFLPEQIAGHENRWNNQAIENPAFLLLNPIIGTDGNPLPVAQIGSTKAPSVPEAITGLLNISNQGLMDILGNPQMGEQLQAQTSGVAMELTQGRIDMQTSGYVENLGDMERLGASIWLGVAKEVYTERGRKIKIMSDTGKRGTVEIGKPMLDKDTGKIKDELSFKDADFDVAVQVGPSSKSKRDAVVRSVTGLMAVAQDPETLTVLTNVAINNMEGQGLADVREWSRKKLVSMGVSQPTKEEQAAMRASLRRRCGCCRICPHRNQSRPLNRGCRPLARHPPLSSPA